MKSVAQFLHALVSCICSKRTTDIVALLVYSTGLDK